MKLGGTGDQHSGAELEGAGGLKLGGTGTQGGGELLEGIGGLKLGGTGTQAGHAAPPTVVTFRTLVSNANAASITIPTGTVAGDLLVVVCFIQTGVAGPTAPTGWTLVSSLDSAAMGRRLRAWRKVYATADGPSYTFLAPIGVTGHWTMLRIAPATSTEGGGTFNATTGAILTATTITLANAPARLLGCYVTTANTTITATSPQTAITTAGGTIGTLMVASDAVAATGATGNRSATAGAVANGNSWLISAF